MVNMKQGNQSSIRKILFLVGIVFLGIFSWRLFGTRWDHESLIRLGYVGIFLAMLISSSTLFLPGPSLVIPFAAVAWFNPWAVMLVAAAGSAIGESTGYITGVASRVVIPPKDFGWYKNMRFLMKKYAFLTIFLLAAIPNPLTDLSGIVGGRIKYSFWKFLLATFLGKLVRFGLTAIVGMEVFR
jgi:membrane protein YqaA with SNARE-associated domain